jgi:adenylate kinase family enzyme
MLSADDPLERRPDRVLVSGVTGVGKSTMAARLGRLWDLPYTELDGLFHGPGWTVRPTFEDDVRALAAGDRWVTEWGYWSSGMGPVLGDRADLVVWLDLPRRIALSRLVRRTVDRRIRRQVLWNGNVEPALHTFFTRPDDNIIRWEMKTHDVWRARMASVEERYPQLRVVHLRHPREVAAWLRGPATRA